MTKAEIVAKISNDLGIEKGRCIRQLLNLL